MDTNLFIQQIYIVISVLIAAISTCHLVSAEAWTKFRAGIAIAAIGLAVLSQALPLLFFFGLIGAMFAGYALLKKNSACTLSSPTGKAIVLVYDLVGIAVISTALTLDTLYPALVFVIAAVFLWFALPELRTPLKVTTAMVGMLLAFTLHIAGTSVPCGCALGESSDGMERYGDQGDCGCFYSWENDFFTLKYAKSALLGEAE